MEINSLTKLFFSLTVFTFFMHCLKYQCLVFTFLRILTRSQEMSSNGITSVVELGDHSIVEHKQYLLFNLAWACYYSSWSYFVLKIFHKYARDMHFLKMYYGLINFSLHSCTNESTLFLAFWRKSVIKNKCGCLKLH